MLLKMKKISIKNNNKCKIIIKKQKKQFTNKNKKSPKKKSPKKKYPKKKLNTYECGHVHAEKNGGSNTLNNLRPICSGCNRSMGIKNMELFIKECGFDKKIIIK